MHLQQLTKTQIENIYNEHMIIDFPKAELKPLDIILYSVEQGFYECLGLFDGKSLVGYTYLVRFDNSYLIDYIAIFPELRNKGIGSNLISIIDSYLITADRIIGEIEDPAYAENREQIMLQTRRYEFYLRNNCSDTGLRVECFGVNYIILESGIKKCKDKDEAWNLYERFYKNFLTKEKLKMNIKRLS